MPDGLDCCKATKIAKMGFLTGLPFYFKTRSKAKQTLLLAFFDPLKIQAKQSKVDFAKSKTRSKAKQSKAKQSQKWENFEKILKKKLKSSDEKRLDYTVSESLPKVNWKYGQRKPRMPESSLECFG